MNILMLSNTFTPHVGGVARSLETFTREYRARGHRVVVVAPEFEGMPEEEHDVIRIPAIQRFNGTDFSVRLPIPGLVRAALDRFRPDLIHAHHPFLLGDTALLLSARENVPLVFTHHTLYEQYTHYVPGHSPAMQRFVAQLSTGYANQSDLVFAPSQSIADLLKSRGVETPIEIVPTGVRVDRFRKGDGAGFRQTLRLPQEAYVIGYLGRLAPEKNLDFLARAVVEFLKTHEQAYFLVGGTGPTEQTIRRIFRQNGLSHRLRFAGLLTGQRVIDAYHAMNVFVFSSKSETQGMVLTEAIAAGVPVVAIDATGVREVVRDQWNGRLLAHENPREFADAIRWVAGLSEEPSWKMSQALQETAENFSIQRSTTRALSLYASLMNQRLKTKVLENSLWNTAKRLIETEWEIWANRAQAAGAAFQKTVSKSLMEND